MAEQLRGEIGRAASEADQLRAQMAQHSSMAERLRAEMARHSGAAENARAALERARAEFRAASARASQAERKFAELRRRAELAEARAQLTEVAAGEAAARAAELERALIEVRADRDGVLASTAWRATWPARVVGQRMPAGMRRALRSGAKVGWWAITLKLPRKLRERQEALRCGETRVLSGPSPISELGGDEPLAEPPPTPEVRAEERPPWADFFDAEWYAEHYEDVAASGLTPVEHFVLHGAAELRDPNPFFDTVWYLRAYPDVASAGEIPIEHFVLRGAEQGRIPFKDFDFSWYRQQAAFANDSYLEAYRRYLTDAPPMGIPRAIWGLAVDAEIRCSMAPSFDGEVALFATYSPDGRLKTHVLHYVESLRREGIAVVLIINAEEPLRVNDADLLSRVDGLFVRQAKGYDFAAWAHVLHLHREIFGAAILYLINDSLIGPFNQSEFTGLLQRIRNSKAEVIGLTESFDRGWHLQSFFLAFKSQALLSAAFVKFFDRVVCYKDKHDVISDYELRLASVLKRAGLDCEPMFRATDARNPTTHRWRELVDSGFPFVKAEVIRDAPLWNAGDCLQLMAAKGFDVRLVEWAASLAPAPDLEPPESEITPPHIIPLAGGLPDEVTIQTAAA
jgi:hypothetical protein